MGLTGLDTRDMSTGQFAYLSYDLTASPTNALDPVASKCVGVFDGTDVVVGKAVTVRMTTAGGKPVPGQPIWLAPASDDSGTAAGKGTATKPETGPLWSDIQLFAGTPPRDAEPVAYCVDASNYDSDKTVVAFPFPTMAARPSGASIPYFGIEYGFPTQNDYLYTAGNAPGVALVDGVTHALLFRVHKTYTGSGNLWLNTNKGTLTKGHFLYASTTLRLALCGAGGLTAGGELDFGAGPKAGLGVLAFTVRGSKLVGCMTQTNGDVLLKSITATATAPDGSCSFQLGGYDTGFAGASWMQIRGALSFGRSLTDRELGELCRFVQSKTPVNRFLWPDWAVDDASLNWMWSAVNGTSMTRGSEFIQSWLVHGTPTTSSGSEKRIRNVQPYVLDARPAVENSRGIVVPACAHPLIEFTVPATQPDVGIGYVARGNTRNFDNDGLVVYVDGVYKTGLPIIGDGTVPDGQEQVAFVELGATNEDADEHTVQIVGSSETAAVDGGFATEGVSVTMLVVDGSQTFGDATCTRRMVLAGEDYEIGQDVGIEGEQTNGSGAANAFDTLVRADYPGRVSSVCAVTRDLHSMRDAGAGAMRAYARRIVLAGDEGAPDEVEVYIWHTFRDYANLACTPDEHQTDLTDLATEIHTLRPTWTVRFVKSDQDYFDSIANTDGYTLSQFDAAKEAAAASLDWMAEVVDERTPTPLVFDGSHSVLTITGTANKKSNFKAAVGY